LPPSLVAFSLTLLIEGGGRGEVAERETDERELEPDMVAEGWSCAREGRV
jgi:hypothetical protein